MPYKLSYKLTHLAFAAFNKNLAFETGQTNCGPHILDISLSIFLVLILKFFPFFLNSQFLLKIWYIFLNSIYYFFYLYVMHQ